MELRKRSLNKEREFDKYKVKKQKKGKLKFGFFFH